METQGQEGTEGNIQRNSTLDDSEDEEEEREIPESKPKQKEEYNPWVDAPSQTEISGERQLKRIDIRKGGTIKTPFRW